MSRFSNNTKDPSGSILIIGRAKVCDLDFDTLSKFDEVCYINCAIPKHDTRINCVCVCCDADYKRLYKSSHNAYGVYVPIFYTLGEMRKEKPVDTTLRKSEDFIFPRKVCEDMHVKVPELKHKKMGWTSTGIFRIFSAVFHENWEKVSVYGFSHFNKDGTVRTPEEGMMDAYSKKTGTHSVDCEREVAEICAKNKTIVVL